MVSNEPPERWDYSRLLHAYDKLTFELEALWGVERQREFLKAVEENHPYQDLDESEDVREVPGVETDEPGANYTAAELGALAIQSLLAGPSDARA